MGAIVGSSLRKKKKKRYNIFFYLCVYLCVCVGCVHVSAGIGGVQKRVLDSLELGLQVVVSHPRWVPGPNSGTL